MDNLGKLPVKNDTQMNDNEKQVMEKFFGMDSSSPKKSSSGTSLKLVAYATLLFALVGNTYIDSLLCHVPHCEDNAVMLLAVKMILFAILFFLVYHFAM